MPPSRTPPFQLTPAAIGKIAEIMRRVGRFEGLQRPQPQLRLRRGSRVRTVLGSVAIEGNTLTLDQATALLEGKRVVGPRRDVVELKNAIRAYEIASSLRPGRLEHLLRAHRTLMRGLVDDAGHFRSKGAGIFHGEEVAHMAPPARHVPKLVQALLDWITSGPPLDGLVKSAVVHYELEFIHPFADGNGRIGRLWQHVMLLDHHPVFEWIPVEMVIRERQADYYRVLAECDRAGDSTRFIEFSLSAILEGLDSLMAQLRPEPMTADQRLELARAAFRRRWFTRKEYLACLETVSTATASRDLRRGVEKKVLRREGDKSRARYRFG